MRHGTSRNLQPLTQALVDDIDGVLVVLCSATAAADVRQTLASWMRQDLHAVYRGAMSRPVARPADMPALYATLRRALAVLGRIGVQGQIVSQDELAIYSTLFETHDQASLAVVSRRDHRPADCSRPPSRLGAGGHAAGLLRLQPERQDHGAAPGDPREHRAATAGHDRRPDRSLGPGVARARDPHRRAAVEPGPTVETWAPRARRASAQGFSRWP